MLDSRTELVLSYKRHSQVARAAMPLCQRFRDAK